MNNKNRSNLFYKYNIKWVFTISIGTFILAVIFSIITENSINNLQTIVSFVILFLIIIIGIIFDALGIAVTKAEEKPFHSMAAKKNDKAKVAIRLIRNAGPVSNFCNDVVGDISGIVSGGIATTLILRIIKNYDIKNGTIITIFMTAIVASLTVGGKAFGKAVALLHFEEITYNIAKFINLIEKIFNIEFFPNKRTKKHKNKVDGNKDKF
ncbi:MAG: hypothetical protein ACTHW2_10970 [Tissierella sp.]|uniref:hypothetical protein n=1 Tax=Tissierella sp. TaxID=41274 RepID=UPI003F9AF163